MNTLVLSSRRTLAHRPRPFAVGAEETGNARAAGALLAVPARPTRWWSDLVLAGLWLFIGWVGALDTYLTVKYRDVMPQVEENPVGRWLMRLDGQDVSLFVGLKVAGIVLVLGLLGAIGRHTRRTFAFAVLVPVALFQLWLLGYLLC